jgi:hypothetical protein
MSRVPRAREIPMVRFKRSALRHDDTNGFVGRLPLTAFSLVKCAASFGFKKIEG